MAELTDWFPAHIKPVREGVYDVRDAHGRIFRRARWDLYGARFCWRTPGWERSIFTDQDLEWRGLSSAPADGVQPARDYCTDPDNCKRCGHATPTWDQVNHDHAGIPVGPQKTKPTAGVAPVLDLDRVLQLADVHAEESREDGCRVFDRGGLKAFADDCSRLAAAGVRTPDGSQQC